MVLLSELHLTHIRRCVGVEGDRKMEPKVCSGMDKTPSPSKQGSQILGFRIFLFHHRLHWDMKRKRYLIMFCLCFQHLIIHQLFACFFLLVFFIDFIILSSIFYINLNKYNDNYHECTIPKTLVLRL